MPKFFLQHRKDRPANVASIRISLKLLQAAGIETGRECTVTAEEGKIVIERKGIK